MQYSDFEQKLLPCRNKNVLLGFSGGADSCALFLILEHWRKILPFELTAIHFEHGLRGEASINDAEFCRSVAQKYAVNFFRYDLHVPSNIEKNETVESAARRLRLEKWAEIAADFKNCEIHLAHHSDDLAENVLLRLFRGANVSGLSGLREYSKLNNLPIRRILLDFSRSDIEQFLLDENFTNYRTDATNFDCSIGRNFLRNKTLKEIQQIFPYAVKGIVQSAKACEDDAKFIEDSAAEKFALIKDSDTVEHSFWQQLPNALSVRVMRMYFSRKLKYEYIPDKNIIDRLQKAFRSDNIKSGCKIPLDDKNCYFYTDEQWRIIQHRESSLPPLSWDWQQQPEIIFGDCIYRCQLVDDFEPSENKFFFDAEKISCPLQITTRRAGEQFEKFGGGHTSVKEELTNRKIHGPERDRIGILRDKNDKILLLGNLRRSSFAPIDGKKQKILQITVEKLKK